MINAAAAQATWPLGVGLGVALPLVAFIVAAFAIIVAGSRHRWLRRAAWITLVGCTLALTVVGWIGYHTLAGFAV